MDRKYLIKMLNAVLLIFLLVNGLSCGRNSSEFSKNKMDKIVKKESKEKKQVLLKKIDEGFKLSNSEINSLSAILLMEERYDEGIGILEKLKVSESYKDEWYDIYFQLSLFFVEKYKANEEKEVKQQLIAKTNEYLEKGFRSTPERALAFYKKSKIYLVMGCIEKAENELHEAISSAKHKNIIFWGDGIYLTNEQFTQIANEDLNRLKDLKDNCLF